MLNKDGNLKESFWSKETMKDLWNRPAEQEKTGMKKFEPIELRKSKEIPIFGRPNLPKIDVGLVLKHKRSREK